MQNLYDIKLPKITPPNINYYSEQKKLRSKKRTLNERDRQMLYTNAKGRCQGCNKKITYFDMQVGHKKAYSKGGATTLANSVCLCYTCNKQQGTDSFEAFLKKRAGTYGKRPKAKGKSKKPKQNQMSEAERLTGVRLPDFSKLRF